MKRKAVVFLSSLVISLTAGALGAPGFKAGEAQACFNTRMVNKKCECIPGNKHLTCRRGYDPDLGTYCVMSFQGCAGGPDGGPPPPIVSIFDLNGTYCGYQCGSFGYF